MSNLFQVLDYDAYIENDYQKVDEDNNNSNDVLEAVAVELDEEKDDPDDPKSRKSILILPEQDNWIWMLVICIP